MEKSMRREKNSSIVSRCNSPQTLLFHSNSPCSNFNWCEEDVWTEIAKYLDGKSLMKLGTANRWFHRLIIEEGSVWKFACLRDLEVPPPEKVLFRWIELYAAAFDGSHSYCFRQPEKHIDWMRIGAFFFDSSDALVTERLCSPINCPATTPTENTVAGTGTCVLTDVKKGIWIADLQLVRCPVCNLNSCEGTMQTLDARHWELFLHEGYKDGSWDYEDVGSHRISKHCNAATGGIFDIKHITSSSSSEILESKTWTGESSDWKPKARIAPHGVAVNTNLQHNDGLNIKYQAMRAGAGGPVISIRISQQLV